MKTEKPAADNHYENKTDLHDAAPSEAPDASVEGALTPETFTGIRLDEVSRAAGGAPAVISSMRHIARESGLIRGTKTLLKLNQKGGVDCPGCAWPDPDGHRSFSEFCENGAKAIAEETTTRRVTPEFFAQHSIEELAAQSDFWLGKQGRLTQPMVKRAASTRYQPISWDDAFALIADELNELDSPDEAMFYTSGRTSNEAAFLYQLFVRQFGTNNLPDCSNMCHESSGTALTETIGVGKGTVTLDDFYEADAIFVVGQNPGTNHPRMLTALQKAARGGCVIVQINPLHETGTVAFKHPQEAAGMLGVATPLETLFLQVKINGDVALLKGIMKLMLEREYSQPGSVLDQSFIEEHTVGFQSFADDLARENLQELEEISGISRAQMQEAADIAMSSKRIICCWAMGLTQHKNAVANIQEIVNFLLLGGNIGRKGAGVCPVRGHSNVQGDRTMGIWERPQQKFLDVLQREFGFSPPREHGYDVVEGIKAMHDGRAKIFFAMGGNFLSASPDTEYTARALTKCRLTAHVSTKLNRAHLVTGEIALILPCLGRTERDLQKGGEQFVSVENSMGVVHSSRGNLEPASPHLLSEPAIVARLATAVLGDASTRDWHEIVSNYDNVRDMIARTIDGFENYNARVREGGGFYLPNAARDRKWQTESGKAQFSVHAAQRIPLEDGQLLMMTIRSHDQYNTTIYGLDDRYRGIKNERRVVLLHRDDIAERGLQAGDVVDLTSHFAGQERVAKRFIIVPFSLPRRCAATYFPETNVLVPIGSAADGSNTPTSKSVVISLRKSA